METYIRTATKNTSTLLIYFITVETVEGSLRNQDSVVLTNFSDLLVQS